MPVCDRIDSSMNQGLEEEKSYTRHAMEYHRKHPDQRRGNKLLEEWSTADYVARAVASQKTSGDWARFSDRLEFLRPQIRHNATGHPFCVVQTSDGIVIVDYLSDAPSSCTLTQVFDTARIKSGDMEFSGRTDYWIYVLRPSGN